MFCITRNGYFVGSTTEQPLSGDYFEMNAPMSIPENQLAYTIGDGIWRFTTNKGQLLATFKEQPLSKLEFMSRFSLPELISLHDYELDADLSAQQKATFRTIERLFNISDFILTSDVRIIFAIQFYITAGKIAADREDALLQ